ncbi:FAD/NAD(P)-binding domain-containing protein [Testicularia cyperi]|uniref:FAD/NAD(P)-binding domain-containing protein n=1 Tax=Testicularia cyperi TaxID=1882483 RepID=A0A317XJW6_9BASI|nr:FAD/NAD(P)-binding domain-containing protein [Testicularia cyperi]
MSLDQTHYDVAIISTGLPQSILSAALSSAGLSVIHLDENDYYADQWASLTLSELSKWTQTASRRSNVCETRLSFPAFESLKQASVLPPQLAALDRHYALSLAPTLLPATGRSIDTLIASKVSSYATFRLLEQTVVYNPPPRSPPALQRGSLSRVPASKEDIFKTKSLSLIAKRKLMKLLMAIACDAWEDEFVKNTAVAQQPFVEYLAEVYKLPPDLIDAVAYGVSLSSTPKESTHIAVSRARLHMKSVGRYGNAAYLVGQYGGAGELAQGYCRASAVKGGIFILDHDVKRLQKDADGRWQLEIAEIAQAVTADVVVSSDEALGRLLPSINQPNAKEDPQSQSSTHRGILVLERPIDTVSLLQPDDARGPPETQVDGQAEQGPIPPETALVVFPPGSIGGNENTVTVLMMGEGTFSCPKGQYVYYIQTEAVDAEEPTDKVLQPVIDGDQQFAATSHQRSAPLLQLTYRQMNASGSAAKLGQPESALFSIPFPCQPGDEDYDVASTAMTALTDSAVAVAEQTYYSILAARLSPTLGDFASTLDKVRSTADANRLKKRKTRDPAEYQGRGGRGADDGVSRDQEEEEDSCAKEHAHRTLDTPSLDVPGFFEAAHDDHGAEDPDD